MERRLIRILDLIHVSKDTKSIHRACNKLAKDCGFDMYAYVESNGPVSRALTSYPQKWQRTYFAHNYSRLDPVVSKAKRVRAPFFWALDDWSRTALTLEQRRMFDGAISHGVRSGLTVPVRGPFSRLLTLTLASAHQQPPAFRASDMEILKTAIVITHYRLTQAETSAVTGVHRSLTPQEIICLTWAAKGKYMPEIAEIMQLRSRTVQHYLDTARAKLNANNLVHAVSLAKDYRLLE